MDFYSNSKPDLIGPKVKKSVHNMIKKGGSIATISDKISNLVVDFYKNYISPYKFFVFIFVIITVFLLYRYYNKEKQNDKKEDFSDEESRIINEILNEQTAHLKYDPQPSFNNLVSVNKQAEPVNYPPDPLPVHIPDKGLIYTKNLYNYPQPFRNLNNPNYNYNNVYDYPSRSHYTGTFNTYANAQDTNIVNPYGWSNQFNTTTGDFVGQMTDANYNNVVDYQTIIDNMQGNLIDGLKFGPQYLNDEPESEMEPPYATD